MGRTREFDIDSAVKKATRLFWRKGYDGTSMSDLLGTMKISAPSFYFAFGSKEALFERIVDSYHERLIVLMEQSLKRGSVSEMTEGLLSGYVEIFSESGDGLGCLILNSSLPLVAGDRLKTKFARQRESFRSAIQRRIQELRAGKRPGVHAEALSRLIVAWLWGLAVEIQSGADRRQIADAVKTAVRIIKTCEDTG